VGIYTRIAAQGHNYEDLYCLNGRWQVLGQIWNGSEREYNYKALRINRSIVRGALLDECAKRGVEIRYGMKCVGVESETDSGATVKFDNGETVTADFVVGADGIHSHIREFVEKDSEPIFTGIMSIGGVVDRSTLPPAINDVPLPGFVFAQAGAFALMPTDFKRQKIGFFMQMPQADRSRDEWTKTANDKKELSRMLKKYCEKGWPDLIKGIADTAAPEGLTNWPWVLTFSGLKE
jgi:2-polyprenyl-6-methoxyphenol hydroxylase-like FAD-dependent oxidoreductase